MPQTNEGSAISTIKTTAPLILIVAICFFVYELWLLVNSPAAELRIYNRVAEGGFTFWGTIWLVGELVGELGLIARFLGAGFFLTFAIALQKKGELWLTYLRKGVFLEAIQYFFFIPFISYLLLSPAASLGRFEAALSYILQLLIVSPIFLRLFFELKKPTVNKGKLIKWGAVGAVAFVFALWIKHFLFNLYALPINLQDPALLVGFVNSAATILVGGLILAAAFAPAIRGNGNFKSKLAGVGLICVGMYFVVYVLVATQSVNYMWYLTLTELWAVSLIVAGAGFIIKKKWLNRNV